MEDAVDLRESSGLTRLTRESHHIQIHPPVIQKTLSLEEVNLSVHRREKRVLWTLVVELVGWEFPRTSSI
jgi:hypothetical protein